MDDSGSEGLSARAISFLANHGPATSAELAAHVFGGESLARLLTRIQHDRLAFDGQVWSVDSEPGDWAAFELLASGVNPHRRQPVELAALRKGHRFHAFVSSSKPVPQFLRRLGVPAEPDVRPLPEIKVELGQLMRGCTLVSFRASPDFIEQLLGPAWPVIGLVEVIHTLESFRGRPDPLRVAKHFGLPPPSDRRPLALVRFTDRLMRRLLERYSFEQVREAGRPLPGYAPPLDLPESPGVYVLADANQQPLYVGKSINLKRRVRSYAGSPIAEARGLYNLLEMTHDINVIPVNTEVEALLLESRLIRAWLPPFNIQRATSAKPRFIRLSTHDPFARLSLAGQPQADGATYFGPFRHTTAAARLLALTTNLLRLRTCTRRLPAVRKPKPACRLADAGRCLAPCVIGPPTNPYQHEVDLAIKLLSARVEEFRQQVLDLLRQRPPDATEGLRLKGLLRALSPRAGTVVKLPQGSLEHSVDGHTMLFG